jgi:hypothetical protein
MTLILVSAWLAIVAWAGAVWLRAFGKLSAARFLWTCGAASLVSHILLALHLVHYWDHDAAERAVARETYDRTGVNWGGGIWINYGFVALWLTDATLWWVARRRYESRSGLCEGAVQFACLFMFVNATVVFGAAHALVPGTLLCALGASGCVAMFCRKGEAAQKRG